MHTQPLDGDRWTVRAVGDLNHVPDHIRGKVFPARVPGCVHLDLIRAGVLRHPNLGYAEREQEWVGRTDWAYELEFTIDKELSSHRSVVLSLDGLDTVAQIAVNGESVGRGANAFTTTRCDVTGAVYPGRNVLTVTISAPITAVERAHESVGKLPHNGDELGWHPFQMIRKPACNFGWDWGPRVATSGFIGSVTLDCWNEPWTVVRSPRISMLEDGRWAIEWRAEFSESPPRTESMTLVPTGGGRPVVFESEEALEAGALRYKLLVGEPDLWWPRGHGAQPLYDLELAFWRGSELARSSWRVGFRTAELDTSADDEGSACAMRINGRPVLCRGANWIPDTLFPAQATPERVRERVRQAVDANMNMLRVWGGGFYEQKAFFDACDEAGVLVWHDLMFACALYPESEMRGTVEAEAREQFDRLAPHPSLVVWSGGNECVEGYQHWGWKDRRLPSDGWGLGLWTELLPRVLREVDPTRPYLPNSPWSGAVEDVRDPDHGDRHTWDLQFEDVRKIVPRFVSEFGRVAPACERTLWEAGVFDDATPATWPREAAPLDGDVSAALEHRLRQTGGSGVAYDPVLPEHFREPAADLRGWLWQTQVLQARALTTHIEWLRANSPRCMGALLWQLNDCWACQSWAIVDHAGRPKPAWYAVRRAFEPRLLTIQPIGGDERLSAVLVNDTDEPAGGECVVRRVSFTGEERARVSRPIAAEARAIARIDALTSLVGQPDDRADEVLVVECAGLRDVWFWERDLRLRLPESPLTVGLVENAGRTVLRLCASGLARDVIIAADLLGDSARAAENCFTMLAGETREVAFEGADLDLGIGVGQLVRSASGPAV